MKKSYLHLDKRKSSLLTVSSFVLPDDMRAARLSVHKGDTGHLVTDCIRGVIIIIHDKRKSHESRALIPKQRLYRFGKPSDSRRISALSIPGGIAVTSCKRMLSIHCADPRLPYAQYNTDFSVCQPSRKKLLSMRLSSCSAEGLPITSTTSASSALPTSSACCACMRMSRYSRRGKPPFRGQAE